MKSRVIFVLAVLILISLVGNALAGFFDNLKIFVLFVALAVVVAVIFTAYFFVFRYDQNRNNLDNTMHEHYKRVNTLLRQFPSGQGILWGSGHWVDSQYDVIEMKGQRKECRSFMGTLENSRFQVLVIYNITDDQIADFQSTMMPELYRDHFHFLRKRLGEQKRAETSESLLDHRRARRRRGVQISLGDDEDDAERLEPPESTVRTIKDMGQSRGESNAKP